MFRSVLPLSLLFGMTLTACGRGGSSGLGNTIDTAGGTGTTNTGNTNTGNTNTGNTGTGNTGTGNTGFSCSDGPTDPEQLFADEFVSLYTRTTDTPYTTDAGVGAIVDALSGLAGGEYADFDLIVNGAVVTNIDYAPDGASDVSFWFADGTGTMRTYATSLGSLTVNDLTRGDVVSFRATSGTSYYGELEVTAIDDFQIVSSGEPIYVMDGNDAQLDYATHGRTNVSVYGEVLSLQGDCGGQNCWDVELANGQMVTLRVNEMIELYVGDCLWWIGPLGTYDGDLRLPASNFDWFSYF